MTATAAASRAAGSLWRRMTGRNYARVREQIIEQYAYLVKVTAGRLTVGLPVGLEWDDLYGAGLMALVQAVDRFDPSRGVQFETFAISTIRGAIRELLRKSDPAPRPVREMQREMQRAGRVLEERLGRPAGDEELAAELGIAEDELARRLGLIGRMALVWLDAPAGGMLVSEEAAPGSDADLERRALAEAVERLPEPERLVMGLYYQDGLTFKEIGEVVSVSESRVFQRHARALVRLRGWLSAEVQ